MTVWSIQSLIHYFYHFLLFSQNKLCQDEMEAFIFYNLFNCCIQKVISQHLCERKRISCHKQLGENSKIAYKVIFLRLYKARINWHHIHEKKKTKIATIGTQDTFHEAFSLALATPFSCQQLVQENSGPYFWMYVGILCSRCMSSAVQYLFTTCFTAP